MSLRDLTVRLDLDASRAMRSAEEFGANTSRQLMAVKNAYVEFEKALSAAKGFEDGKRAARDYQNELARLDTTFTSLEKVVKSASTFGKEQFDQWAIGARAAAQEMNRVHAEALKLDRQFEKLRAQGSGLASILGDFAKGAGAGGGLLGGIVTGAGMGLGMSLINSFPKIIAGMRDVVTETAHYAETIHKAQLVTDLSADSLQNLQKAGAQTGASFQQMERSFTMIERAIGNNSKAFRQLGLDTEEFTKLNTEQKTMAVVDALMQMEDVTRRNALAQQLLGRGYMEILPAFEAYTNMRERYVNMTSADIGYMAKTNDEMGDFKTAMTEVKQELGVVITKLLMLPSLIQAAAMAAHGLAYGVRAVGANVAEAKPGEAAGILGARATMGPLGGFLNAMDEFMYGAGAAPLPKPAGVRSKEAGGGSMRFFNAPPEYTIKEYGKEDEERDKQRQKAQEEREREAAKNKEYNARTLAKMEADHAKTMQSMVTESMTGGGDKDFEKWLAGVTRGMDEVAKIEAQYRIAIAGGKETLEGRIQAQREETLEEQHAFIVKTDGLGLSKQEIDAGLQMIAEKGNLAIAELRVADSNKRTNEEIKKTAKAEKEAQRAAEDLRRAMEQTFNRGIAGVERFANALQGLGGDIGKVGTGLGALTGGASSVKSGIADWKSASALGGVTGAIGKAGVIGSMAATALSIGSTIVGLFKSDPVKVAQKEIAKTLGHGISYEFAKEVMNLSKELGKSLSETAKLLANEDAMKHIMDLQARQKTGMQTAIAGIGMTVRGKAPEGFSGKWVEGEALIKGNALEQGRIWQATFWGAVATEGVVSAVDAFKAMFGEGKIAAMVPKDVVAMMNAFADPGPLRDAALAAQGYAQSLSGLAQAGWLNKEMFKDYGAILNAGYQQAIDSGSTEKQALLAVLPLLAEMKQLHEQTGVALDENTQKLIAEAEAQGIAFPVDPMIQVRDILLEIAKVLGATIPESADAARRSMDGLGDNVGGGGHGKPKPTQGGGEPDLTSAGGLGPVTFANDTILQVHKGEKGVIVPRGRKGSWAYITAAKGLYSESSGESGGGGYGGGGGYTPAEIAAGATGGTTTVQQQAESLQQAIESVRAAAEQIARTQPIQITNAPSIQLVDQSLVKTPEGQRAFGTYVQAEMERALDQNSRGLTTKVEQIARRAVGV